MDQRARPPLRPQDQLFFNCPTNQPFLVQSRTGSQIDVSTTLCGTYITGHGTNTLLDSSGLSIYGMQTLMQQLCFRTDDVNPSELQRAIAFCAPSLARCPALRVCPVPDAFAQTEHCPAPSPPQSVASVA